MLYSKESHLKNLYQLIWRRACDETLIHFYTSNLSLCYELIKNNFNWKVCGQCLKCFPFIIHVVVIAYAEGAGKCVYCFHQDKSRTIYTSLFSRNDVYFSFTEIITGRKCVMRLLFFKIKKNIKIVLPHFWVLYETMT